MSSSSSSSCSLVLSDDRRGAPISRVATADGVPLSRRGDLRMSDVLCLAAEFAEERELAETLPFVCKELARPATLDRAWKRAFLRRAVLLFGRPNRRLPAGVRLDAGVGIVASPVINQLNWWNVHLSENAVHPRRKAMVPRPLASAAKKDGDGPPPPANLLTPTPTIASSADPALEAVNFVTPVSAIASSPEATWAALAPAPSNLGPTLVAVAPVSAPAVALAPEPELPAIVPAPWTIAPEPALATTAPAPCTTAQRVSATGSVKGKIESVAVIAGAAKIGRDAVIEGDAEIAVEWAKVDFDRKKMDDDDADVEHAESACRELEWIAVSRFCDWRVRIQSHACVEASAAERWCWRDRWSVLGFELITELRDYWQLRKFRPRFAPDNSTRATLAKLSGRGDQLKQMPSQNDEEARLAAELVPKEGNLVLRNRHRFGRGNDWIRMGRMQVDRAVAVTLMRSVSSPSDPDRDANRRLIARLALLPAAFAGLRNIRCAIRQRRDALHYPKLLEQLQTRLPSCRRARPPAPAGRNTPVQTPPRTRKRRKLLPNRDTKPSTVVSPPPKTTLGACLPVACPWFAWVPMLPLESIGPLQMGRRRVGSGRLTGRRSV